MKKDNLFTLTIVILFTILITAFSKLAGSDKKDSLYKPVQTGEELAKIYCATCHIFPSPSLLDKSTWQKSVLQNMGWRLGIRKKGEDPYANMEPDEAQIVQAENVFPLEPLITKDNWQKIVNYYIPNSA